MKYDNAFADMSPIKKVHRKIKICNQSLMYENSRTIYEKLYCSYIFKK